MPLPAREDGAISVLRPAAVFDLDRTLVEGSSLAVLGRLLAREGKLSPVAVATELARHPFFGRSGATDSQIDRFRARLLRLVAGMEHLELLDAVNRAANEVTARVFTGARWLIEQHLRAGDRVILVSASPQDLVGGVAARLGAEAGLGTQVEIRDGRVTGRLDGTFCYGQGKLVNLGRLAGDFDLARATGYADSWSDLPLLEAAGQAVAVNPDRRLDAVARQRHWPVIHLS